MVVYSDDWDFAEPCCHAVQNTGMTVNLNHIVLEVNTLVKHYFIPLNTSSHFFQYFVVYLGQICFRAPMLFA